MADSPSEYVNKIGKWSKGQNYQKKSATIMEITAWTHRLVWLLGLNIIPVHVIVIFEGADRFIYSIGEIEIDGRLNHLRYRHRQW